MKKHHAFMSGFVFLILAAISETPAQAAGPAEDSAQAANRTIAIRVVDGGLGKDEQQGLPRDDRVPVSALDKGLPDTLWLKRDGLIAGDVLADAHIGADAVSGLPIVEIQLTAPASELFAALTRANIGHRIAVVVKGKVITAPVVITPILGGKVVITGFSADQARVLVAEIMAAERPAGP